MLARGHASIDERDPAIRFKPLCEFLKGEFTASRSFTESKSLPQQVGIEGVQPEDPGEAVPQLREVQPPVAVPIELSENAGHVVGPVTSVDQGADLLAKLCNVLRSRGPPP